MTTKICTKCGLEKPLEDYYKRSVTRTFGYRTECKKCHSERHKYRYATSDEKREAHYHAARKYTLNKYGLYAQDYESMLQQQNYVCKICKKPETWNVKGRVVNLCVDHCHETGKVRGLLCRACNVSLGKLNHDTDLFKRCIDYLEGKL